VGRDRKEPTIGEGHILNRVVAPCGIFLLADRNSVHRKKAPAAKPMPTFPENVERASAARQEFCEVMKPFPQIWCSLRSGHFWSG
jgi:hypothetical protein